MKNCSYSRCYRSFSEVPVTMTVLDVQIVFGISRSSAYRLMHLPDFPAIRVGNTLRVPKEKLLLWIDEQAVKNAETVDPKIVASGDSFSG